MDMMLSNGQGLDAEFVVCFVPRDRRSNAGGRGTHDRFGSKWLKSYSSRMAERVWRVNWIGFLGFIGFAGFLGFFYDAPQAFVYFAYFEYFYYFTTEITAEEKRRIRTAGTAAYLMAFLTNMTFIVLSYIRGSVDYETGFYLAYIMGSVTFPATSFLMEAPHKLRRVREQIRKRLSAANR